MKGRRLKIFLFWGLILSVASNGGAYLLGYLMGDQSLTQLLSVLIVVGFSFYAGYMSASSLKNDPSYKNRLELTMVGVSVAFVSAVLSWGIDYFLTGKLNFGIGFLPVIFAGLGSYIVARKSSL